jgi:predicted dienelactone hydrolase
VGVCTQTLHDPSRNRSFDVEYWYPVDLANPGGAPNEYSIDGPLGAVTGKFPTSALRDANAAAGAHPTVLFSHGFGGIRFQSYFLTERLASHGFIVVAPDHPGNRLQDVAALGDEAAAAQSAIDRPLDVVFALDQLLYGNSCAKLTVDSSGIGATGHSFGGWTALTVAHQDPRFAAVFPMAPGFKQGATPEFVAEIDRPLMLFGGSEDGTTPFESDQLVPYELAQPPKYLVEIEGAGHLDFSNLCEVPIAQLFIDDGCDPQKVDPKLVQAVANTLAVAFAQRHLAHDESFSQYLDGAHVLSLGGLEYWREAP